MELLFGFVMCMAGGALVGANTKNLWGILGVVLAQLGVVIVAL